MTDPDHSRTRRVRGDGWWTAPAVQVLITAGLLGAWVGVVIQPEWPDAIEPAQVLAGLVTYPPDAPVYIYSTATWTILHQLAAVALADGITERHVALAISAFTGMLSFQALAMTVWAIAEDRALSIAAPFFIFLTNAAGSGFSYPIMLVGPPSTYGMVALSALLLVFALPASGRFAAGAFLLGALPALHVTAALWGWMVAGIAASFSGRSFRTSLCGRWRWFAAGLGLSVVSAAAYFERFPAVWATADVRATYMRVFAEFWDSHGQPYDPVLSRIAIVAGGVVLSLVSLRLRQPHGAPLSSDARFLARCVATSAVVGGSAWAIRTELGPGVLGIAWSLMPSRLLNIPVLASMAMFLGLLTRTNARWAHPLLLLMAMLALGDGWPVPAFTALGAGLALWMAGLYAAQRVPALRRPSSRWWRLAAIGVMSAAAVAWSIQAARESAAEHVLPDRTTNAFLADVSRRPGLLLTAGELHLIQAVTRRPVLLDGGAMDTLGYAPQMGPALETILREVYGIDVRAPWPTGRSGTLPPEAGRELWQARTVEEWQAVARRFGVTDVMTPDDWVLSLPVVTRGMGLVVYAIPPSGAPLPFRSFRH